MLRAGTSLFRLWCSFGSAGDSLVQIDPELPTERQQFIGRDSDAQFILSSSDLLCFPPLGAIDINDESVRSAIDGQDAASLRIPDPGDLSYILYTSGVFRFFIYFVRSKADFYSQVLQGHPRDAS